MDALSRYLTKALQTATAPCECERCLRAAGITHSVITPTQYLERLRKMFVEPPRKKR